MGPVGAPGPAAPTGPAGPGETGAPGVRAPEGGLSTAGMTGEPAAAAAVSGRPLRKALIRPVTGGSAGLAPLPVPVRPFPVSAGVSRLLACRRLRKALTRPAGGLSAWAGFSGALGGVRSVPWGGGSKGPR